MQQKNDAARIRVCIVYPADPAGVVPGGIDTFIRGLIRWAPEDIEIMLVGVTTDSDSRPVGSWTLCDLGKRKFQFYPVAALPKPGQRGAIPLTIRFVTGLLRMRPKIVADVLEFHRVEPNILFCFDRRPKNAFVHQNMQILRADGADIMWRKWPGLFYWLEGKMMRNFSRIYAVRRDAVADYKQKYSDIGERFSFIPTWYDPEVFFPVNPLKREQLRARYGIAEDDIVLLSVGRLDPQKDPLLLAAAFKNVLAANSRARLVYVGDGMLRRELEAFLAREQLGHRVDLLGLRAAPEVAELLNAADLFVLTSVYEGMPMCVLEALGSGLPVVTTEVGEVRLVVEDGVNGRIALDRSVGAVARAILDAVTHVADFRGSPCVDAVSQYQPSNVLEVVYQGYREMAGKGRYGRQTISGTSS